MHKQQTRGLGVLLALGILLSVSAFAPPSVSAANMMSQRSVATADRHFAQAAAQGGVLEVLLGKLAEQRGSSPSVRAFGRRMVTDHVKVNRDLDKTADSLGLKLDWTPTFADRMTAAKFARLSGGAFDATYKSAMVRDHSQDVSDFKTEANSGQTPAIRNFAKRTLNVIQDHLRMAQDLKAGRGTYAHRMSPR